MLFVPPCFEVLLPLKRSMAEVVNRKLEIMRKKRKLNEDNESIKWGNCKAGGKWSFISWRHVRDLRAVSAPFLFYIRGKRGESLGIHQEQLLLPRLESNMRTRLLLGLLALLLAASFCCSSAELQAEKSVFVSGKSECLDCAEKNVNTELAYKGIDGSNLFLLWLVLYVMQI